MEACRERSMPTITVYVPRILLDDYNLMSAMLMWAQSDMTAAGLASSMFLAVGRLTVYPEIFVLR